MKKYIKLYEEFINESNIEYDSDGFINDEESAMSWVMHNCLPKHSYRFSDRDVAFISSVSFRKVDNKLYVDVTIPDGYALSIPRELRRLSIRFGIVKGNFKLYESDIITLRGFPREIHGNLAISALDSLPLFDYEPDYIKGDITIGANNLITTNHLLKPDAIIYKEDNHALQREELFKRFISDISESGEPTYYLDWLDKLGGPPADFVEYVIKNNIESVVSGKTQWFSDDVQTIANAAMKGNHKLR